MISVSELIKTWPIKSPSVRLAVIRDGLCPDCGSRAPRGVYTGGVDGGGELPAHCYKCGFKETWKPKHWK
jgi:DNA-directed RNA polymerase subunit RPC12/RpoP